MVYRNTGLAAVAVAALALFQLTGLLRPTEVGTPWQIVVVAGLLLGTVITWAGLSFRLPWWVVVVANLLTLGIVAFRIVTPDTMVSVFPTTASFTVLSNELSQATAIIRNGIEPVIPVPGLVALTTAAMWGLGATAAYGLSRGRPALAVVPGLIVSAQFTTMARTPTDPILVAVFVILLATSILAVTSDQRRATAGRMAHSTGDTFSRRVVAPATVGALSVTLIGSLLAVGAFRSAVPVDGMMEWRATSGLSGSLFGGVAYNPFISIRNSLVSDSDVPVFVARVSGGIPASETYFQLLTMENYDSGQFAAGGSQVEDPGSGPWEDPGHAFAGPTISTTSTVVIDRLRMEWLPAPYSTRRILGDSTLNSALRVRSSDTAVLLDGTVSYASMQYTAESDVPRPDLAALSSVDGTLSPLFMAASAAGEPGVPSAIEVAERPEPPDAERYLELPEDLDIGIEQLARQQTANLDTPFEKALGLEAWLQSDEFRYTTSIPPGHGATDVAEWLLPRYSDQPFHRAGYCENFATAMAVMARTLGIHSRVVLGFTPGEPTPGDPDVVVVRDRNAHAWVELWMPSQGWVRFDPTPRGDDVTTATNDAVAAEVGFDPMSYLDQIDLGDRPQATPAPPGRMEPPDVPNDATLDPDLLEDGQSGWEAPPWMAQIPLVLLVLTVLLGALPLVKWWRRRRRMTRLRNGDVTAAWDEIVAQLTDLGQRPDDALTPNELADAVAPELRPLASVYGRAVYAAEGSVRPPHLATAEQSMRQTTAVLAGGLSPWQRIVTWYRPGSVLPQRRPGTRHRSARRNP